MKILCNDIFFLNDCNVNNYQKAFLCTIEYLLELSCFAICIKQNKYNHYIQHPGVTKRLLIQLEYKTYINIHLSFFFSMKKL